MSLTLIGMPWSGPLSCPPRRSASRRSASARRRRLVTGHDRTQFGGIAAMSSAVSTRSRLVIVPSWSPTQRVSHRRALHCPKHDKRVAGEGDPRFGAFRLVPSVPRPGFARPRRRVDHERQRRRKTGVVQGERMEHGLGGIERPAGDMALRSLIALASFGLPR